MCAATKSYVLQSSQASQCSSHSAACGQSRTSIGSTKADQTEGKRNLGSHSEELRHVHLEPNGRQEPEVVPVAGIFVVVAVLHHDCRAIHGWQTRNTHAPLKP